MHRNDHGSGTMLFIRMTMANAPTLGRSQDRLNTDELGKIWGLGTRRGSTRGWPGSAPKSGTGPGSATRYPPGISTILPVLDNLSERGPRRSQIRDVARGRREAVLDDPEGQVAVRARKGPVKSGLFVHAGQEGAALQETPVVL